MISLTALYKTFRGNEFVIPSIESIYEKVEALIFINSEISWNGEKGNNVKPIVAEWKEKYDTANKIHMINYEGKTQVNQYNQGMYYINMHNLKGDYIVLIDTDEVWDGVMLDKAKQQISHSQCRFKAYSCNLYTYIKSPFFRIEPPEPLCPITFIRRDVTNVIGARGNHVQPQGRLAGVWFHHFTYVRSDYQTVVDKIKTSHIGDGLGHVNLEKWKVDKWDRLPNTSNFHTSAGFEKNWRGIKVITIKDLPPVFVKHENLLTRYTNNY